MGKKKRIRTKVTADWNEESTIKLICAVQSRDLLWNASHKDYKSRHLRETAWCEMSENIFENEFDVDQLSVKWSNLRIQFKSYDIKNKISWKYYNQMMFLIASEDEQTNISNSKLPSGIVNEKEIASKLMKRSSRNKRKSSITSAPDNSKIIALNGIQEIEKEKVEMDSYQIFANFVAEELRKFRNPSLANRVQRKLTRFLMDCLDEAERDDLLNTQNTSIIVEDQLISLNNQSEIKIEDQIM